MVFNYAMKLYNITLLDDESDITLKELPVKFVYKDSKFLGSMTISVGIIVVLGSLAYLIKSLIEGESMIHPLIAFGVGLIFFPVFLIGLNMLKKKREFTFTQDFIQKSFSNLFQEEEWKALVAYINREPIAPESPPTLGEAIRMVATIGGFLGRKGDGVPGTETIWRGLQRLDDLTEMWKIMMSIISVSSDTYG